VDITSVQVTNDASNLHMQVTLAGDISQAGVSDWGNYHIGFDTAPGGKTTPGVGWGQTFGISAGMDWWLGSWVNFGGGAELHQYTGDGTSNDWGATVPGTSVALSQFATTITIPLSALGLSNGSTFSFDVWSTFGAPGGQSAYDASSNPALAVPDPWNGTAYLATLVSTYTVGQPVVAATWNADADGNWSQGGNWSGGVAPNGVGHSATFGPINTLPRTITVDAPQTVGSITFNSANSYTIVGASALTLDASAGPAAISVTNGNHTIAAPVALNDDLNVTVVPAASVLTFGNPLAATGRSITKSGAGVVVIPTVNAAGLTVGGGAVRLAGGAGTSRVNDLTIAGGATPSAQLDLGNNAFVIDYASGGPSPLATVKAQVASGFAGGSWNGNGIVSSNGNATQLGVGYGEASALATVPPVFGSVDSTTLLLRLTRYGDANLDGTVNLADFNRLAASFGATGAVWTQGDFDYDGNVNLSDFNRLAGNFGQSAGGPSVTPRHWANLAASIPEPASLALIGAQALSCLRRRKRKPA
jgi:hypothetical protein